jgi:hypothetical protein
MNVFGYGLICLLQGLKFKTSKDSPPNKVPSLISAILTASILSFLFMSLVFAGLFPFIDFPHDSIGFSIIPLVSGTTVFCLTTLLALPWSGMKILGLEALFTGALAALTHGIGLSLTASAFQWTSSQEWMLICLVLFFLLSLSWQSVLLYARWTETHGIPTGYAAALAGLCNLLGLGSGCWIWYKQLGAESLEWDVMFFL